MDKKKCNKCLEIKHVSLFGKESRAKNGYKPRCKECTNEYMRNWNSLNKKNISLDRKEYYIKNKNSVIERVRKYYYNNKKTKSEYNKKYRQLNKNVLNKKTLEYIKKRIKTDDDFRLTRLHRKLIHRLKIEKIGRTSHILGYTKKELFESLGRYPSINECVDHKIPVSWFKDKSNVKLINDLRNLQILSRYKNSKKSDKFCHEVDLSYYNQVINEIKEQYKSKVLWK